MRQHFLPPRPAAALRRIAVVIVFCAIGVRLFTHLERAGLHPDEVGWFTAGYRAYQLMFIERDFSFDKWMDLGQGNYGVPNLPAGKYLIGLASHALLPRDNYVYVFDFSKTTRQNVWKGNVPPWPLIQPARIMSAVFAFGSCLCMFWFCRRAWNGIVALLAAAILGFNGLFVLYAHRAMTDIYLVFFFLLTIVLLTELARAGEPAGPRFVALSALYGVAVGLSVSVKLNGGLGMVYLLCLFGYLALCSRAGLRRVISLLGAWLLAALCCGITIVALYPYFYTASPRTLARRALWIVGFWQRLLEAQIRFFTADVLSPLSARFFSRLAGTHFHWLLAAFALVGIGAAAVRLRRRLASRQPDPAITPLIFLAVNLVGIGAWIPLDWDRYYLPIVIAEVPLAAYGMYSVAALLLAGLTAVGWSR